MKPNRETIVAMLLAGLMLAFFSCSKEEEKTVENEGGRPIKMMTVISSQEAMKRSFSGKVRASKRVELAFQVSGPLIELPIEEGQSVNKDALLARIDPRDFQVNLRNTEGALASAKASLKAMRKAQSEGKRGGAYEERG